MGYAKTRSRRGSGADTEEENPLVTPNGHGTHRPM